uniref:Uncharacterized protein n=1 Tax=Palpitomonas bilix TaxID=652834 RepID=A0A7S3D4T4_9EUKA
MEGTSISRAGHSLVCIGEDKVSRQGKTYTTNTLLLYGGRQSNPFEYITVTARGSRTSKHQQIEYDSPAAKHAFKYIGAEKCAVPRGRSFHSCVGYPAGAYLPKFALLAGGFVEGKSARSLIDATDEMYLFDCDTHKWGKCPPLNWEPRSGHVAVAFENKLIIHGGLHGGKCHDNLQVVKVFE